MLVYMSTVVQANTIRFNRIGQKAVCYWDKCIFSDLILSGGPIKIYFFTASKAV